MLYGIVAKPGEGKSYFAVTKIYDFQQTNIQNIKSNIPIYYENKKILEERDLLETEFTFTYEIGNKEYSKTTDYDFYNQFEDEEQFEDYFEYYFFYNKYIEKIESELKITLAKLHPVHQIYSNINGLKIPGVLPMPIDLDWRKTPMGSIHFIDEIRDFYPYNNKDGRKISTSGIIKDMSKVRHTDKDVWLITQDAEDYNYSLRQLFDKLYFVKRPPSKMQACAVYVFDQYLSRPRAAADSQRDPKKYVDYFLVIYKKKYQNMYVSASSHTSMIKKINWKVFFYIFLFLLFGSIVVVGFLKIPVFSYFGTALTTMKSAVAGSGSGSEPKEKGKETETMADQYASQMKIKKCVDDFGYTPDQCSDLLDPVAREAKNKELEQSTQNSTDAIVIKYNSNDPYATEIIQHNIQVRDYPRLSGCAKNLAGDFVGFDQQGNIMPNLEKSACKKWLNGERLFDYTKDSSAQAYQQPQQPLQQTQTVSMTTEELAKYQQAKEQGLI